MIFTSLLVIVLNQNLNKHLEVLHMIGQFMFVEMKVVWLSILLIKLYSLYMKVFQSLEEVWIKFYNQIINLSNSIYHFYSLIHHFHTIFYIYNRLIVVIFWIFKFNLLSRLFNSSLKTIKFSNPTNQYINDYQFFIIFLFNSNLKLLLNHPF